MASVSDDDVAMKPPAASESTTQPSTTVPDNEAESNTEKDIAASASAEAAAASDPNTTTTNNTTNNMTVISLGGKRSQKSFAILDGVFQDPESDEKERVTIDITRLPALLGRSNESDKDDPNFFGLGKKKALSRKHCTIYYRDKEGGHAEWDTTAQTTIYKDVETVGAKKSPPKPNPHLVKDDGNGDETKEGDGLPPNGFFAIECLGKNRILVDRTRVEQGESMVLRSGSAIRISSYMFYFLLPADAEPKPHLIELPLSDEEKEKAAAVAAAASTKHKGGKKKPSSATKAAKKRSSISSSSSKHKSSGKDKTNTTGTKKASGSASKKRPVPTIAPSAMKKPKKAGTNSATTTLAELEILPVEELIEKMDDAVSKGLWDRKNQFIGATVCYHAVRSAGAAIPIQEKVVTGAGVSRSDIMEWIEQSDMYGGWVQQMLTNMEPRSYQAAVTKSLLKSGFTRTSGAGRYIKWLIPDDIPMKVKAGKKKKTKSKSDEGKTTKPKPKPQPIESVSSKEKDDEGDNETGDENDNDSDDDDDDDDGSNSDHQPGETPNKEEGADEEEEEEEEEEDASGNDAGMEDDNNEADENEDESDANEEEDGNEDEIEDDDDDTNKNKDNNNCNNDNAEEEDEQSDDNAEESDMDITF